MPRLGTVAGMLYRAAMTVSKASTPARGGYSCAECDWTSPRWVGRCGGCQAWGTVTEAPSVGAASGSGASRPARAGVAPARPAEPITSIDEGLTRYGTTGVTEFDRVLGGGLVPGAVVLLAGEPGAGKSTLALDAAARIATQCAPSGGHVLYISGEESAAQVSLRARRIGAIHDHLLLAASTDLAEVVGLIAHHQPRALVLDSVQTIASADVSGAAGSVSQVKEVTAALIEVAKRRSMPCVLIGHVTKDGAVAGPRTLEHLVDVVCQFEGDRHTALRLLRAVKNRYGPTSELGCFELTEAGISGVTDPSALFRSAGTPMPGACTTITMEGRRPLAVEIQALVTPAAGDTPRRATQGVDTSRVAMITAVLTGRLGVTLSNTDLFVSTIGGARVREPAADLAIAMAILSALSGQMIPATVAACGEVSLTGEIRPVTAANGRLAEATRLGFDTVILPTQAPAPAAIATDLVLAAKAAGVAGRVS